MQGNAEEKESLNIGECGGGRESLNIGECGGERVPTNKECGGERVPKYI